MLAGAVRRWLAWVCLLGACATAGQNRPPPDGGPFREEEPWPPDAGRLDAGAPDLDAGLDASGPDAGGATAPDSGADAGTGVADAGAGPTDAGSAGVDAGSAGVDAGTDAGMPDAGPPPPPGPGTYLYTRVPVGGMHEAVAVAFHPDGSYAIAVERDTTALVYDWASRTATRIDLRVGGRALTLTDLSFDPSGAYAVLAGYETVSGTPTGVLIRADDASLRAGPTAASFTRLTPARSGERFVGVEWPPPGEGPAGGGRPVVLSQSGPTPGYIARLRDLDVPADAFGTFLTAQPTSAGCDDLAFADNEFGTWGIVLVCGTNGADAPYYTEIGGVGSWRPGPAAILGNASRAASHGAGDYVLGVSWSGRDLDRFQAGAWLPASAAPGWATLGIWDVSFSPDGSRALIVGQASGGTALVGTALEYRHDLYSLGAITNVSIPGFGAAPYLGTSSTMLDDSAFRPGCDGGLVVGGQTGVSGSTGLLIEFQIEAATPCR